MLPLSLVLLIENEEQGDAGRAVPVSRDGQ